MTKIVRAIGLALAALMSVALISGCSNAEAEQANAYINALNQIGQAQNQLAQLPQGSPELKTAIATAVPKMQTALDQMKAAQPNLTGSAKTVADGATPEAQKMVESLNAASTALAAGDEAVAVTALAQFDDAAVALQGYVKQWNDTVATQK